MTMIAGSDKTPRLTLMTNPAGAESFYGSRHLLKKAAKAARRPDIFVRFLRGAFVDNKSFVNCGPDMNVRCRVFPHYEGPSFARIDRPGDLSLINGDTRDRG